MKTLSIEHFENSDQIIRLIIEYEAACEKIAGLGNRQIVEDMTSGEGNCPVCGTKVTNLKEYADMIYCGKCMRFAEKHDSR